ncbi:hypothetical protein DFH07DRAFT_770019 [Mycena maculata]|uniref:Uncharacterized protein n=1 Tax=Mycena maculata TaxID=230809 RepID=A0AAD7JJ31_9AGAR|nr:hypothetical protein DFH07DRAFT_770019 [Mycena maculata]
MNRNLTLVVLSSNCPVLMVDDILHAITEDLPIPNSAVVMKIGEGYGLVACLIVMYDRIAVGMFADLLYWMMRTLEFSGIKLFFKLQPSTGCSGLLQASEASDDSICRHLVRMPSQTVDIMIDFCLHTAPLEFCRPPSAGDRVLRNISKLLHGCMHFDNDQGPILSANCLPVLDAVSKQICNVSPLRRLVFSVTIGKLRLKT